MFRVINTLLALRINQKKQFHIHEDGNCTAIINKNQKKSSKI